MKFISVHLTTKQKIYKDYLQIINNLFELTKADYLLNLQKIWKII
jgi:hypothetical protein